MTRSGEIFTSLSNPLGTFDLAINTGLDRYHTSIVRRNRNYVRYCSICIVDVETIDSLLFHFSIGEWNNQPNTKST